MEKITFKKRGFLYYLTKLFYYKDPKDTCTYRWQIILSIIIGTLLLPITLLRAIPNLDDDFKRNSGNHGAQSLFLATMLFVLGNVVFVASLQELGYISEEFNLFQLTLIEFYAISFMGALLGLFCIALAASILGGIIYGIYWIYKKLKFKPINIHVLTNDEGEPVTQLGTLYLSFKEKWCKLINWED